MAVADMPTAAASPDVVWESDGSWLRCVVGWPGAKPQLAQVLPLFEHLGLVLIDHRPQDAADSFMFAQVEDPNLDDLLPLLAEAFTAAWERTVDRDRFASLVLEAHLDARQVQLGARGIEQSIAAIESGFDVVGIEATYRIAEPLGLTVDGRDAHGRGAGLRDLDHAVGARDGSPRACGNPDRVYLADDLGDVPAAGPASGLHDEVPGGGL